MESRSQGDDGAQEHQTYHRTCCWSPERMMRFKNGIEKDKNENAIIADKNTAQ